MPVSWVLLWRELVSAGSWRKSGEMSSAFFSLLRRALVAEPRGLAARRSWRSSRVVRFAWRWPACEVFGVAHEMSLVFLLSDLR
jgi:hypothetical protein